MIRFALGFLLGLACAGWVAAHPQAAHMIAAGEHVVGQVLAAIAAAMSGGNP